MPRGSPGPGVECRPGLGQLLGGTAQEGALGHPLLPRALVPGRCQPCREQCRHAPASGLSAAGRRYQCRARDRWLADCKAHASLTSPATPARPPPHPRPPSAGNRAEIPTLGARPPVWLAGSLPLLSLEQGLAWLALTSWGPRWPSCCRRGGTLSLHFLPLPHAPPAQAPAPEPATEVVPLPVPTPGCTFELALPPATCACGVISREPVLALAWRGPCLLLQHSGWRVPGAKTAGAGGLQRHGAPGPGYRVGRPAGITQTDLQV